MDKAGKTYWDGLWEHATLPQAVNPRDQSLNNYVNRKFHEYFEQTFSALDTKGKRLLEIGCARSAWLPYFAKEFGFEVRGLDYSEQGCQQARAVLSKEGVTGEIVCADFFSPPTELIGAFDVIVSFGVAEHFQNTSECISAFARFLKPGGLLVTSIPNMVGLNGSLQKLLNRAVFEIHVPLDKGTLAEAHCSSGLEVIMCEYFLPVNLLVVNIERMRGTFSYNLVMALNSCFSKLAWLVTNALPLLQPNPFTSPYINCLAKKPLGPPHRLT
jgi:cyclopropane fatty-acyl-phospholipid synthase-like methyltransferase